MAKIHQYENIEDDINSSEFEVDSEGRQYAYEKIFAQWEYMSKQVKSLTSIKVQLELEKIDLHPC